MLGTSTTIGEGGQVCWGLVQLWGEGGRCAGD